MDRDNQKVCDWCDKKECGVCTDHNHFYADIPKQHCTQCEIGQQNLDLIAEVERLKGENKKLTFMVENGLGYEDLKNDI